MTLTRAGSYAAALLVLLVSTTVVAANNGPPDFEHMEQTGPCNYTRFAALYAEQRARVEALRTGAVDKDDLLAQQSVLWQFEEDPDWRNCLVLVAGRFARWGPVNRTHHATKQCFLSPEANEAEWLDDPCCNRMLEVAVGGACCAPRDVTREQVDVIGMNATAIAARCHDPERTTTLLDDLRVRMANEERCRTGSGEGIDMWSDLFGFRQTCQIEVFGEDGTPPECRTSADCWSDDCDTATQECAIPWQDPFNALVSCYVAHMDAEMYMRVLEAWNVTDQFALPINATRFKEEFMARLTTYDCVGPRAWEHQGRWVGRPCNTSEAESDPEHCHCWSNSVGGAKTAAEGSTGGNESSSNTTTTCWWNAFVPGNETACLAEQGCSWQSWLTNETDCLADNATEPAICTQCWGSSCNRMGDRSECRAYGLDQAQCEAQNGTYAAPPSWQPWAWGRCTFPDLATMEDCTPQALCPWAWQQATDPAAPKNVWGSDYHCSSKCFAPAGGDNATACAELAGVQGTAQCVLVATGVTDQTTCTAASAGATYDGARGECITTVAEYGTCAAEPGFQNYPPLPGTLPANGSAVVYWRWPRSIGTWFDADSGICSVSLWEQADCLAGGYAYQPARVWHQGFFETEEECTVGVCDVNPSLNATQCVATGWCNRGCPACRSRRVGHNQGVCYAEGACPISNATGLPIGTYKEASDACVFEARSEAECAAYATITTDGQPPAYETCETLSANQTACAACERADAGCPLRQDLLQCYVNRYDRCETEEQCEAAGDCNDWAYDNWFHESCRSRYMPVSPDSDAVVDPTIDCNGACQMPFDTSRGWIDCPWSHDGSVGRSSTGCLLYNQTNATMCAANGGVWKRRAHTAAECEAQSEDACFMRQYWIYDESKNSSECATCGGKIKDPFRWDAGQWTSGQMRPLNWTAKAWRSINAWAPTINYQALDTLFNAVGARYFAVQAANEWLCAQAPLFAALTRVACDCGDVRPADLDACYADADARTLLGAVPLYPAIERDAALGAVTLQYNGTAAAPTGVTIYTSDFLRLTAVAAEEGARRRKRAVAATSDTEDPLDVVNAHGAVVGRVVSLEPLDVAFEASEEAPTVAVCFQPEPEFAASVNTTLYPTPVWAVWDAEAGELLVAAPDEYAVTLSELDGYCVTLSQSAVLYAARVLANWADAEHTPPAPACPATCTLSAQCAAAPCPNGRVHCQPSTHVCCAADTCRDLWERYSADACLPAGARDACTQALLSAGTCQLPRCGATTTTVAAPTPRAAATVVVRPTAEAPVLAAENTVATTNTDDRLVVTALVLATVAIGGVAFAALLVAVHRYACRRRRRKHAHATL